MSNSFQMPRNPADFRPPSALGADGSNLFAETDSPPPEASPGESADSNLFRSPAASAAPAYQPTRYETTIPHRAKTVQGLGIAGLVMLGLGVAMLAMFAWLEDLIVSIVLSPVLLLNLVFTLPAWIMSYLDLNAMEAGAMHSDGRIATRRGGWFGVLGTFLTLLLGLPAIAAAVYAIISFIQAAM